MTESAFIHRFEPARDAGSAPLLLLHGTGGDENDLLGLGKMISPGAALLSPRGRVLEHGMPRFFRRLAEGVFDEDDVRRRARELGDFVGEARQRYGIAAPVAVGFSNGANIAAALLLLQPGVLAGAPWCHCQIRPRPSSAASPSCSCPDRLIRSCRRATRPGSLRCCRKRVRVSITGSCQRAINCRKPT
jgi:predicted esterase